MNGMHSASRIVIDLQIASTTIPLPATADFERWAAKALEAVQFAQASEITVRVVDEEESRQLNHEYRDKDKPTNVLSFPSDLPDFLREQLEVLPLGDLVICAPVVTAEAREQGKAVTDHWAHLTVHGVLHLLGFDHIEDDEAAEMEGRETAILADLGIADPYEPSEH